MTATAPMQIGLVTLNVRQLDKVSDYYRHLLGLDVIDRDGSTLRLGAGKTPLLELRGNPELTQRDRRSAGLFHTAFLMSERAHLAAWLRYVAQERIPVGGASDHAVSEAFYFDDPEGNGIEVYRDRPRADWPHEDGFIPMTTDPLDIADLLRFEESASWSGAPADMIVGHMHLQVGDLATAKPFYSDVLGADITCNIPSATFYGVGGYHHQLATNTWSSRGAGQIDPKTTGLVGFELITDTKAQRDAVTARAGSTDNTLTDPWGLALTLSTKEA